ncbi:hypothetical protein, partial [Streptodolium elevatio]
LTFGTLLSSQGTDASFETLSPVSPGVTLFGVSLFLLFFPRFQLSTPFPVCFAFRFAFGIDPRGLFPFGSSSLAADFPAAKPVSCE